MISNEADRKALADLLQDEKRIDQKRKATHTKNNTKPGRPKQLHNFSDFPDIQAEINDYKKKVFYKKQYIGEQT